MFKNRCSDRPDMYMGAGQNMGMQNYPEAVDASAYYAPQMGPNMGMGGQTMPPIYECPQERVVNREFNYEVPQV